jgi:hypothetical protein
MLEESRTSYLQDGISKKNLIGLKLYTNLEDSTTTGGSIERHYI